ncbi:MAG: hypothetical protein JWN94_4071, partial [Betaproteobacteria bacterium]|nr:hypothetical protein [Betaproteobacteria bacterium]
MIARMSGRGHLRQTVTMQEGMVAKDGIEPPTQGFSV